MSFNINQHGSIQDALNLYRTDIYDTVMNMGNVLDVYADLVLSEGEGSNVFDQSKFPIRFEFKGENISLNNESDGIHLYNGLEQDKGVLFNKTTHEFNYDIIGYDPHEMFSYINESYSANDILLEACDLAIVNDDMETDISALLGSKYGPQAASLSSGAKDALDQIQTYLQHSDKGPTGVASFISTLYAGLASTQTDSDGFYYQSADKVWQIQGFVGSYAIRTVVKTAAYVIGAVISVCQPIIGIAIGLLAGALSKIKGMFLDFTSAQVHINPTASNNLLNMSLFDYNLDDSDLPREVNDYFNSNPDAGSVQYRMVGCTWIFTKPQNGAFHLQIMCNVEFNSTYTYGIGLRTDNQYKTCSYSGIHAGKSYTDGYKGIFGTIVCTDLYAEVIRENLVDGSGLDAQARSSVMNAYHMLFGMMAAMVYGHDYVGSNQSSMPSDGNTFDNASWTYNHHAGADVPSWASIVQYRNMLRNASSVGPRLCQLFHDLIYYWNDPTVLVPISRRVSFPWASKFYMEVPNYTTSAVWYSILAVGIVATVTIAAAVVVHKIKTRVKKFMARKQVDIEGKRYRYQQLGTDEAFDDYWKSMRHYNNWATLFRYDKIDLMTGYIGSSSSQNENDGYGINLIKKVRNSQGDDISVDLTTIYRLIAGS